jgi:hypothetical protein
VGFDVTDQLLIRSSVLVRFFKELEYNEAIHQLFIDVRRVYDSVKREVLYTILIEFGVPIKPVRLSKICLNETHIEVNLGLATGWTAEGSEFESR